MCNCEFMYMYIYIYIHTCIFVLTLHPAFSTIHCRRRFSDMYTHRSLRTDGRESLFLLSRRWRQFSLISALISENYDSTGRPTYRRRTFRTIIGFLITTLLPCTNDFALSLTVFRFENQPIDTINRMAFNSTSFIICILVRTLWIFFLLIKYHFSLMFDVLTWF